MALLETQLQKGKQLSRGTRSEASVDEAENVKQFIEEAKGRGTLLDYLVYLKQLGEQQEAACRNLLTSLTTQRGQGAWVGNL